jgi:hypothetical protein
MRLPANEREGAVVINTSPGAYSNSWSYDQWKTYLNKWWDYYLDASDNASYEEFVKIKAGYNEAQDAYDAWLESLSIEEQLGIRQKESDALDAEFATYAEIARKEAEKEAAAKKATDTAYAAKPITLKVNGVTVTTDSPPVIENGRTLAPARAVAEALGNYVTWNASSQTIGIYSYATDVMLIQMRIGSNRASVLVGSMANYDERILDVPAKLINGRTMVPVRFIAEALGCVVNWDQANKIVSITSAMG